MDVAKVSNDRSARACIPFSFPFSLCVCWGVPHASALCSFFFSFSSFHSFSWLVSMHKRLTPLLMSHKNHIVVKIENVHIDASLCTLPVLTIGQV